MKHIVTLTKGVTTILMVICLLSSMPMSAGAADYPEKPLKILVGYAPGGGTDRTARILQRYLEKHFGKEVIMALVAFNV